MNSSAMFAESAACLQISRNKSSQGNKARAVKTAARARMEGEEAFYDTPTNIGH